MMKYYNLLLVCIPLLFFGCSDTIEFNNPAMQANFEGTTWKADYFAADIDFGGFVIEGGRGIEIVQLITTDDRRGVYELGPESGSKAIYRAPDGTVYSTSNMPDPSISIYPPDGIIEVEDIDNADPKRIVGNFRFTAYTADGLRSVNFISGVFYKVSLVGGLLAID